MRITMLGLLAAASFTGMTIPAQAADITVRGSPTCGAYLAAKEKSKHGDESEAFNDLVWFLGYMSGLAVGTNADVLAKNDNGQGAMEWLDVYCPRHPTKYMSDAGDVFYAFLKQQGALKQTRIDVSLQTGKRTS